MEKLIEELTNVLVKHMSKEQQIEISKKYLIDLFMMIDKEIGIKIQNSVDAYNDYERAIKSLNKDEREVVFTFITRHNYENKNLNTIKEILEVDKNMV